MQRFLLLSTIVHGLLLAGLATMRGEFLALAIPFALYLVVGFWEIPQDPAMTITRSFSSDRVVPGADVVVSLTVQNLGQEIEELSLEDGISPGLVVRHGSPRKLIRLGKGSSYTFSYTIAGLRGAYMFDTIHIAAAGRIKLIDRVRSLKAAGQLYVFPVVRRLKSISIRPRSTRVYAGLIPARVGGTGTDFFGVRDYQPGDLSATVFPFGNLRIFLTRSGTPVEYPASG